MMRSGEFYSVFAHTRTVAVRVSPRALPSKSNGRAEQRAALARNYYEDDDDSVAGFRLHLRWHTAAPKRPAARHKQQTARQFRRRSSLVFGEDVFGPAAVP